MKLLLLAYILSFAINFPPTKEKVTFYAEDGLEITADYYRANPDYPFILLFHQGGSSRGEYNEIAPKLTKLSYNCLVVDLRSGDHSNFVNNETSRRARSSNKPNRLIDTEKDIMAAIDYAYGLNSRKVILFGSSYSASLCMVIGKDNPKVSAVIAFSPGEFFGDQLRIEEELDSFNKPLFVASTRQEYPYVTEMLKNLPEEKVTFFLPDDSEGTHGAKALWESNESKDEYWLALLFFFNALK